MFRVHEEFVRIHLDKSKGWLRVRLKVGGINRGKKFFDLKFLKLKANIDHPLKHYQALKSECIVNV